MNKFKKGDRIVRISKTFNDVPIGYSCEVTCGDTYINVNDNYVTINEKHWQLEERHVHHDLIIAWAKGAKIQYYSEAFGEWTKIPAKNPSWSHGIEYRVAPTQTDAERITELEAKVKELESRL